MDERNPEIFKFADPTTGKGLTVKLTGDQWNARETKSEDLKFYQEIVERAESRGTPFKAVIAGTTVSTAEDLLNTSIASWQNGSPGAMTVISTEGEKSAVFILSDEEPGVAKIISLASATACHKGSAAEGIHVLAEVFAPEVRRIGQTRETFKIQELPLAKLVADIDSSNPRAAHTFESNKFKPASKSHNDSSGQLTRYERILQ
jgi:hypothetical protein